MSGKLFRNILLRFGTEDTWNENLGTLPISPILLLANYLNITPENLTLLLKQSDTKTIVNNLLVKLGSEPISGISPLTLIANLLDVDVCDISECKDVPELTIDTPEFVNAVEALSTGYLTKGDERKRRFITLSDVYMYHLYTKGYSEEEFSRLLRENYPALFEKAVKIGKKGQSSGIASLGRPLGKAQYILPTSAKPQRAKKTQTTYLKEEEDPLTINIPYPDKEHKEFNLLILARNRKAIEQKRFGKQPGTFFSYYANNLLNLLVDNELKYKLTQNIKRNLTNRRINSREGIIIELIMSKTIGWADVIVGDQVQKYINAYGEENIKDHIEYTNSGKVFFTNDSVLAPQTNLITVRLRRNQGGNIVITSIYPGPAMPIGRNAQKRDLTKGANPKVLIIPKSAGVVD